MLQNYIKKSTNDNEHGQISHLSTQKLDRDIYTDKNQLPSYLQINKTNQAIFFFNNITNLTIKHLSVGCDTADSSPRSPGSIQGGDSQSCLGIRSDLEFTLNCRSQPS